MNATAKALVVGGSIGAAASMVLRDQATTPGCRSSAAMPLGTIRPRLAPQFCHLSWLGKQRRRQEEKTLRRK
ncbi:unnamed protein product [Coffea canephora]|uniref:Uncharacterized protein n=1 Tax=Coffea canephora TaxID=49390 RepID=A0A068UC42_COFCA|nr:unnamed protein product [Coffea canephora]